MRVILDTDRAVLFHGDSATLELPDNSVDAIITDPPAGIGFMGAAWDKDKGGRDAWVEWLSRTLAPAYRALKPGGYGFSWALPRTSHWTAWAIEDAGFEIRDVHHHIFGSGMPKSIDLCRDVDMHMCQLPGRHYDKNLPPPSKRREDDHLCPEHPLRENVASIRRTGLKPAVEHWILFRKPLEGTYAENALKYGTGGMNVEACRIPSDHEGPRDHETSSDRRYAESNRDFHMTPGPRGGAAEGRWPAHLSLDPYSAFLLDEQTGDVGSNGGDVENADLGYKGGAGGASRAVARSKGGASRFFYVAKPARSEKDLGLDHLPARSGGEATGRDDDSLGTKNPRAGAGRTGGARNDHATVKSTSLMSWLLTLVAPPGGVILDPFAGSGTTGVAALDGGWSFIGCEEGGEEGKHLPVLLGRIRHALGLPQEPIEPSGR